MSGLTIYGVARSRAARTYWMARELGLDYESNPVHFATGETKTEAFLAINPNGRIPAIDDDGFRLYESMAINLYLAEKHGGPLALATLQERALASQWSFWVMTEVEKPLLTVLLHRVIYPEDQRRPDIAAEAIDTLDQPFAVLDRHLAERDYLVADRFTVADLNVASVFAWARMADVEFGAYTRLEAWLTRCLGRPAAEL